ncbi:GNAT family N-acetyltransferase [Porphyrobacter sp. CACIAM 03H1]|uniref:GNAT family N-acetyltransferase n=1 Tax=Porphyrobacter sp. CACIAM 03H1 TaxID=2003315 RepID=UPI000B5A8A77|nr:GNAT family N-acetyltransferase [Porphyrobacter sp. CACIAM 03H1]ASJ90689.1 GNAT family N-acetyltransferase [Porphyrobacter sp. CACIAM 03H1]
MTIQTQLNDGTPVCIRRVRPEDEARLKEGIARLSPQSRYLRFFSGMREAPPQVLRALASADGHDHIAWGALRSDLADTPALGVVHAFRDADDPEAAEYSVAVIDEYHGRGLARLLTAVLLLDCAREGLERFTVHILPENRPALALARSLGAEGVGHEGGVSVLEIDIAEALAALRAEPDVPGLAAVFEQFGEQV